MEKLKVGVIGVGLMGSRHARIYSEMSDVELYAIADTDEKRRQEVAQRLGASKNFSNYQDLLALEEIDMVDICTPDELHLEPVVDALEAKKHIFLEKPLATDLEEARKIVDESQKHDLKFMVGHLLRFDPRFINAKNAIEAGDLGEIINIISHRNSSYTEGPTRYKAGTSLTMHVAVHDLDLIYWFMKSRPLNISAEFSSKKLVSKNMHDAASALIKFENGAFASVNYSWVLPEKTPTLLDARMEVVGTKGSAYIGSYHKQGVIIIKEEGIQTRYSTEINGKIRGALYEELRAFVDCVKEDKPTPIPPEEAFESVKMADKIINSLQKK